MRQTRPKRRRSEEAPLGSRGLMGVRPVLPHTTAPARRASTVGHRATTRRRTVLAQRETHRLPPDAREHRCVEGATRRRAAVAARRWRVEAAHTDHVPRAAVVRLRLRRDGGRGGEGGGGETRDKLWERRDTARVRARRPRDVPSRSSAEPSSAYLASEKDAPTRGVNGKQRRLARRQIRTVGVHGCAS